jgi:hypothetical protein
VAGDGARHRIVDARCAREVLAEGAGDVDEIPARVARVGRLPQSHTLRVRRCNPETDTMAGLRWWLAIWVMLAACERRPIFQAQSVGGFVVTCVSLTDFNEGLTPCNSLSSDNGGCRCAQPGVPLMQPQLNCPSGCSPADQTQPLGVITFRDTSCTTTLAQTCVPRVILTHPGFQDPNFTTNGALRMPLLLSTIPEHLEQLDSSDVRAYAPGTSDDVSVAVSNNARDEIQGDCKAAHYSMLTQDLFGYAKGSLEWASAVPMVAEHYNPFSTGLNGQHLKDGYWGTVTPPAGVDYAVYATHLYDSPTSLRTTATCNIGMQPPGRGTSWGLAALNDFNAPAPTGNQPPPQTPPSHVASRQSAVLSNGSSGLLTISGVGESASLDLRGGVEITTSDCSDAGCAAHLSRLAISAAPFSFQGYDVARLEISSATGTGGSLVGSSLIFTSVTGTLHAALTDGRFDDVPIGTGVILARWDRDSRQVVLAFAFESVLSDGTTADMNGTAFGVLDDISPTARIEVASPAATVSGSQATIECASASGTNVELSGQNSSDPEDGLPKLAWWGSDTSPLAKKSTANTLTLPNLPLGNQSTLLMAYDSSGFADDDELQIAIVDTLPPVIRSEDVCVFPPDHKTFCMRLGHELQASATDQCQGDLTSALAITNVTSSTGTGVVSFDSQEACLIATRSGTSTGETYSVTLSASDNHGNVASHVVYVTIPHNGPRDCLKTQSIGAMQ